MGLHIVYAGISAPSAKRIAEQSEDITAAREHHGDINWGRNRAATALNPNTDNVTNKRVMRELFAEHGVPMPRLLTLDEARGLVANGITVLGRPDRHWKGRGFWKTQDPNGLARALAGTRKKKAATHFMEFIGPDQAPKEFRAHIFKGRSIRISEKATTAFHEYTTIRPTIEVDHIRVAAKAAVAAVGLDFGAVDILANETSTWVLEVNAAPGLGGSMPRVYAEAFLRWKNEMEDMG